MVHALDYDFFSNEGAFSREERRGGGNIKSMQNIVFFLNLKLSNLLQMNRIIMESRKWL